MNEGSDSDYAEETFMKSIYQEVVRDFFVAIGELLVIWLVALGLVKVLKVLWKWIKKEKG